MMMETINASNNKTTTTTTTTTTTSSRVYRSLNASSMDDTSPPWIYPTEAIAYNKKIAAGSVRMAVSLTIQSAYQVDSRWR